MPCSKKTIGQFYPKSKFIHQVGNSHERPNGRSCFVLGGFSRLRFPRRPLGQPLPATLTLADAVSGVIHEKHRWRG